MTVTGQSIDPMRMTSEQILDDVNKFLETQTRYVEETLERLDQLRAAVIRRDEGALEQMSAEVRNESQRKTQYDRAMQALRQRLSVFLDCPVEKVCLSRLFERLDSETRSPMCRRQAALQSQIRRLNNEVRATESLLHECARFNRLLLSSLFGNRLQSVTYDARGVSQSNLQGSLMNMRF